MYEYGEESAFMMYYHAANFYFLGSILSTGILLPAGSSIDNDYSGQYKTADKKNPIWHKVHAVHLFETDTYSQWHAYSPP
eukprot:11859202-Prorocentrum_lima.AAC.1